MPSRTVRTSPQQEAVIVDAVRSPMGRAKPDGGLAGVHPVDLLAAVFRRLVERTGIEPAAVDDVIVGCVGQVGEQSGNPGRMAWLAAGYPTSVPAVTIERKCGSSQQALDFAAQGIAAGAYDLVLVAGVESMSRVPIGSPRLDKDPYGEGVSVRFSPGLVPQGISSELMAQHWNLDRDQLDAFAARSHQRAAAAAEAGRFAGEIVAIPTPEGRFDRDETIRPATTVEGLAGLRPAFDAPQWRDRFPRLPFHTTAGNSSQLTDGASAILLASAGRAQELGLRPRARFVAAAVVGDDPLLMLSGPIAATQKVLGRAGLGIEEIDHFEVNEAFASVPLAWQIELGAADERLNPRGGAIALGHPLGASGCRLMTTMLNGLEDDGGRLGLQTMCEAGGMANATIIERI